MADPVRCPACDAETPADPASGPATCRGCGRPFDPPPSDNDLPFAADVPTAIPVRPPPARRRRPTPGGPDDADLARVLKWCIIAAGLMTIGLCLLAGLLSGPMQMPAPRR